MYCLNSCGNPNMFFNRKPCYIKYFLISMNIDRNLRWISFFPLENYVEFPCSIDPLIIYWYFIGNAINSSLNCPTMLIARQPISQAIRSAHLDLAFSEHFLLTQNFEEISIQNVINIRIVCDFCLLFTFLFDSWMF